MGEDLQIEFLGNPETLTKKENKNKDTRKLKKDKDTHVKEIKRDINIYWSLLYGLGGFIVFYGIFPFLLFDKLNIEYLVGIFRMRGSIPYVTTFVFFWAVSILILKIIKIRQENEHTKLAKTDLERCDKNEVVQKVGKLYQSDKTQYSTIVALIYDTFKKLDFEEKAENINETLEHNANIEMTRLESSYSIVKTIIWAIPVIGFIGTVVGISAATGGFVDLLQGASDFAAMKEPLKNVANGLAKAFETTLLALFWSLIVMFFSTFVEKREENLFTDAEEFSMNYLHEKFNENRTETEYVSTSDFTKRDSDTLLEEQKKLFVNLIEKLDSNVLGISNAIKSQKALLDGFDGCWKDVSSHTDTILKEIDNRSAKIDEQITVWQNSVNENNEKTINILNALPAKLSEVFDHANVKFAEIAMTFGKLPDQLGEYTRTMKDGVESIKNTKAQKGAVLEALKEVIGAMEK